MLLYFELKGILPWKQPLYSQMKIRIHANKHKAEETASKFAAQRAFKLKKGSVHPC